MQSLQSIFAYAFHALESHHPLAPWLAISLIPFAVVYAVRKWSPKTWLLLESFGPESGTAVGAVASNGDPSSTVVGAVVSLVSPLLHHLLKALPAPYRGAVSDVIFGDDDDGPKPPHIAAMLLICAALTGCSEGATVETARNTCHANALAEGHRQALELCPVGAGPWESCEYAQMVESATERALEECDK